MSKRKCPYLEYEWCYDCDGEEFKEKICPIEQYYKGELIKCYCSTEYKECITYNLKKEIDRLNKQVQIMERYLELIYDLGYNYDGFNKEEDLKNLIDELCRFASLGRACNITEYIYGSDGKKYNILHEELGEDK